MGPPTLPRPLALLFLATLATAAAADECPAVTSRGDLPALLNCLNLLGEAVEVGVQAGVHAAGFLRSWKGRKLHLVDLWRPAQGDLFYVDIANVHGLDVRRQHRAQCEERLAAELRSGRAALLELESAQAAGRFANSSLDFAYLDARHDFAGAVADLRAWWPKVKPGGVFAGHDFVDGEFPEGDFFWRSALRAALPELVDLVEVTREEDRYPSFFLVKTEELARLAPREGGADTDEAAARRLYAERSRYFRSWSQGGEAAFPDACRGLCEADCGERAGHFRPTQSPGSTLRPFATCEASKEEGKGTCGAAETFLDVEAYLAVCRERCGVTCLQRSQLFAAFGAEILSV